MTTSNSFDTSFLSGEEAERIAQQVYIATETDYPPPDDGEGVPPLEGEAIMQMAQDIATIRSNSDYFVGSLNLFVAVSIVFLFGIWFYRTFIR